MDEKSSFFSQKEFQGGVFSIGSEFDYPKVNKEDSTNPIISKKDTLLEAMALAVVGDDE